MHAASGTATAARLRVVTVDRRQVLRHAATSPIMVGGLRLHQWAHDALDRHAVPDGTPFVIDTHTGLDGLHHLNGYLISAAQQRALDLKTLREWHVYHLVRLLRYVRRRRALTAARAAGLELEQWLHLHDEPAVDLSDTSREDLVAYRDFRRRSISASTWTSELGCLGGFFHYAVSRGWMADDPRPRWGAANRSTLSEPSVMRRVRFLTEPQLRAFLALGVRGDHPAPDVPASPERDYAFALTLVTTGLRREEGALLLHCELPQPEQVPPGGVVEMVRYGKGGRPRTVHLVAEYLQQLDTYRRGERQAAIAAAQPTLRRRLRQGGLLLVDRVDHTRTGPALRIEGQRVPAVLLSDEDRARAVTRRDDGTLEPLGLFVSRGGLPPTLRHWNALFTDAHARLGATDCPDQPPAHLRVTPHVLRHTFAVRMLAGLMRIGRDRSANPYQLLTNPLLTVQQLLGHADPETTKLYLFAAELYSDELPTALREHVAGSLANIPGEAS